MQTGAFVFILLMGVVFDACSACASNQRLVCKKDPSHPTDNPNVVKKCGKKFLVCCNIYPFGSQQTLYDTCS
ncbi:hypothetical protein PGTUg99_035373 [Puccinia graminis f. sp. tritici]|uniref:Uncharacterized protein n=1 Tax=Puccinia graminis f. sp. tritici TaxID=56615 RepID=A0A5B0SFH8_PUCGR|nr:hypothetical protein PGTUg99_035373 [Puccinia graminis f. sp. tritici]